MPRGKVLEAVAAQLARSCTFWVTCNGRGIKSCDIMLGQLRQPLLPWALVLLPRLMCCSLTSAQESLQSC